MNYYNFPEFIAYAILVGIALVLIREQKEPHLKCWLAGWIIILLHAGIYMLIMPTFLANLIGRGLLASAGMAFVAAASTWKERLSLEELFRQFFLVAAPNISFAVISTAYPTASYGSSPLFMLLVLTIVGFACTIWNIIRRKDTRRSQMPLLILSGIAFGIQIILLCSHGSAIASQWQLCWIYLAVAYFCIKKIPQFTMGVALTAVSFVLWGVVFPIYSFLQIYAPIISHNIESMIWNLPKFLTAASMILVLLEEKIARATLLATHDELTGLPNRRLYEDRFEYAFSRAHRTNRRFAVLIIDLNHFKEVNDTLGHQIGDELLQKVSKIFRQVLRSGDTLARTGGDEFTVLLEDLSGEHEAETVCNAIRQSLGARLSISGINLNSGASVGFAIFPDDGKTKIDLHSVADHRMYRDKETARSKSTNYSKPNTDVLISDAQITAA